MSTLNLQILKTEILCGDERMNVHTDKIWKA